MARRFISNEARSAKDRESDVGPALRLPQSDTVGPDTPLRLKVAAAMAFPDGGMTASGLRNEYIKGRLRIERIANKDFVTLGEIEKMRNLCAQQNLPNSQRSVDSTIYPSKEEGRLAQAGAKVSARKLRSSAR